MQRPHARHAALIAGQRGLRIPQTLIGKIISAPAVDSDDFGPMG